MTLREAALISKRSFKLFFPALLTNVKLSLSHLIPFSHLLARDPESARSVKSLRFQILDQMDHDLDMDRILLPYVALCRRRTRGSNLDERVRFMIGDGIKEATQEICRHLTSLQALVILEEGMMLPFRVRINGKLLPTPFFTSLKKLHIPLWEEEDSPYLNARNVVWLLVFCECLEEASLGYLCSVYDFDSFLSEHVVNLKGSSNVKKLALRPKFVFLKDDSSTWWGQSQEEASRSWKGGNKKGESIVNLLSITRQLLSLEICYYQLKRNPGDETSLQTSVLLELGSSFTSLRLLRLFFFNVNPSDFGSIDFTVFKQLNTLSVDKLALQCLLRFPDYRMPSTIKTLILPCYMYNLDGPVEGDVEEDILLASVIRSRMFPGLKEVIVPSGMVDFLGRDLFEITWRPIWEERRTALKEEEAFIKGEVQLREVYPGERSE